MRERMIIKDIVVLAFAARWIYISKLFAEYRMMKRLYMVRLQILYTGGEYN